MVLNLSNATSYFNAEEVAIEHLYGLVIDLDTGIVSVTEEIDNDLVYNYTIIEAKYQINGNKIKNSKVVKEIIKLKYLE